MIDLMVKIEGEIPKRLLREQDVERLNARAAGKMQRAVVENFESLGGERFYKDAADATRLEAHGAEAEIRVECRGVKLRWRATDEAVSEEVGVEVHTEETAPQPVMNTSPHTLGTPPAEPVLNSRTSVSAPAELRRDKEIPCSDGMVANVNSDLEDAADGEAPLNEGELEALRLQGGGLNPGQVAADAEYTAAALREGMVMNSCNQYGHDADCTDVGQHIPRHGKEGHTKPQRKEEQKRTEELPSDSVSKVLTDSDGHQYVRIPNHVKSWEDAEKILSAKIDLAVDKKGSRIKGVPGKGVLAPGMKQEVFITKPSMKSMLSGAHTRRSSDKKAHFSAAASADQLWRVSVFKSEEPDSRTNNPNLKIHRRTAEMRIGKQSYQVLLTAKIYSTKNDVSELHMVEIIK